MKSKYGFTGYVDEVAVWTTALTASEVENLYNDGEGRSAATYSNDLYAFTTLKMEAVQLCLMYQEMA